MSFNKIYVGENVSDLDLGKPFEKYIEVIFNFESDDGEQKTVFFSLAEDWKELTSYSVGDLIAYEERYYICKKKHVSGVSFDETKWDEKMTDAQVLELTMPVLTNSSYAEQIAENVLTTLNAGSYKPYAAKDSILDPAFQLGDGVIIDGTYSVIGTAIETCDGLYSVDIGAQGRDETEDEFVYKAKSEKTIQRQIAKSSSSLRITVDGIEALVSGLAPEWKPDTQYRVRDLVRHNDKYFTCLEDHISDDSFDESKWTDELEQATLINAIKLNITDGLVLTSDAGSDQNSCYIQLKYGDIVLFGRDILMNNVTAERLKAQTINAEDVDVAGALEFFGSLNYPSFRTNTFYEEGDRVYDRVRVNPLSDHYVEGVWECRVDHTSEATATFLSEVTSLYWDFVGDVDPEVGGYIGFGTGKAGSSSQPTKGVVMASGESGRSGYGDGDHYAIVTDSGVRLQDGNTSLYLAGGRIRYSLNGTSHQDLGYAVFS